jgi:hypothetical protein
MTNLNNIGLALVLTTLGLATVPTKGFTYDFHYTQAESEIFTTDFNTDSGWSLSGTNIDIAAGTIKANSAWGKASYAIAPVNLAQGDIFLYWSGIFPQKARTESDKYYLGLQYADNDPVCYNSQTGTIVGMPPCTGTSVSEVDENAELKVEMRPRDKTNINNTYHRVYLDPDFDPVNNYSPATTRLNVPTYQETVPMDFRLGISQKTATEYEASLSFWNGVSWLTMTPKQGYSFPLTIGASDWIDATINDARWYQFRLWLEYFGAKFGKITVAVPPHYTSVNCSECGAKVTKTLSTRTHKCKCGCELGRDHNAARNILSIGLSTVGHTGSKAWGDETSILAGENLLE